MNRINLKNDRYRYAIFVCISYIFLFAGCRSNTKSDRTTWQVYRGSVKSTNYSGLKQINKNNVDQLQIAWTFKPKDAPEGARFSKSETSPIVVDEVIYTASARGRIYVIDAGTGEKIWDSILIKAGV